MNIAEAKQQVKDTVEAYLAKDDAGLPRIPLSRQRPVFLVGAPGIGKTAIMEQVASELEIGIVSYSMTHHTRQSALGLPFIVHRDYGGEPFDVSEYTMSEIIASVYDYMEATGLSRGILFLDEVNCVSETLYPSMLQFLQFKTFGRHRVPDDWIIVCAGNPPEYNKSVHEFDIVTLDRLRKIEVEPDYAAWKAYALATGVHPAITSFLEVKPKCFYSVVSTPSGKSFVTARGWDDLSDMVKLFEDLGKPVGKELASQFIQDPDIAEKFAVYYNLFDKYRSDCQVDEILAGRASADIFKRADAAPFDERLALLSLVLDALSVTMKEAVDREWVTAKVRDELRNAKPELLDGATIDDAVAARIDQRASRLDRKVAAHTIDNDRRRRELIVIETMKDLVLRCRLARETEGPQAFEAINKEYRAFVGGLSPLVRKADAQLGAAFSFLEEAFGDESREMVVFVTELTARAIPSEFINRFGSDAYYAHNSALQVSARKSDLIERIAELGLAGGDARADESAPLAAYYANAAFEYGFASLCKMTLPDDLAGKRVLDIGCRRGKGVFKLSARVGERGEAIGVDWVPAFIEEAVAREDRAWRDNGLSKSNMRFAVAYPEDLAMAGIGDGSVDVVVVNSSINLAYDLAAAYREIFRVLAPGGLLVSEAVYADRERDEKVVDAAKAIGNSVQAAPSREALEQLLSDIGFAAPTYEDTHEVAADAGFTEAHRVEVADSDETVRFFAGVMHVRK